MARFISIEKGKATEKLGVKPWIPILSSRTHSSLRPVKCQRSRAKGTPARIWEEVESGCRLVCAPRPRVHIMDKIESRRVVEKMDSTEQIDNGDGEEKKNKKEDNSLRCGEGGGHQDGTIE